MLFFILKNSVFVYKRSSMENVINELISFVIVVIVVLMLAAITKVMEDKYKNQ